jgi:two-component system cell cycle response regulator CtrA
LRVLLIEDDDTMARTLALALAAESWTVEMTDDGDEAVALTRHGDFDVVLLDLLLPGIDGYEVLKRLRAAGNAVPVLILTGIDSAASKVRGFGIGADDYLTKPFDRAELIARISAIVRRARGHATAAIACGRLTVDLALREARIDGVTVRVTAKEFAILEALALRGGAPLSKDRLMSQLYGGPDEPDLKIIDVYICKLRKKLAAASGGEPFVRTLRGHGYALTPTA